MKLSLKEHIALAVVGLLCGSIAAGVLFVFWMVPLLLLGVIVVWAVVWALCTVEKVHDRREIAKSRSGTQYDCGCFNPASGSSVSRRTCYQHSGASEQEWPDPEPHTIVYPTIGHGVEGSPWGG